jgi:dienelactone hydrolase
MYRRSVSSLLVCLVCALAALSVLAGTEPLELVDLMKMRSIRTPVVSDDGAWVAYELRPDRGDGELVVASADGAVRHAVPRGADPAISSDSRWAVVLVRPTLEEQETAEREGKKGDDGLEGGLAILSLADGSVTTAERVESFALSEDGRWLAYLHGKEAAGTKDEAEEVNAGAGEPEPASPEELQGEPVPELTSEEPEAEGVPQPALPVEPEPEIAGEPTGGEEAAAKERKDERLGATLVLRELATGREVEVPHVTEYAFDAPSAYLAYAVAAPGGDGNGAYLRSLGEPGTPELALRLDPDGRHTHLTWSEEGSAPASLLAFVAAPAEGDDDPPEETDPGTLYVWDGALHAALASADAPEGWYVPSANELSWSTDGERLFFGLKPLAERLPEEDADDEEAGGEQAPFDPYELDAILEDRGVDVWGWEDPLIVPQQKKQWDEERKRVYRAVYHRGSGRAVPLADREMRQVDVTDNPVAALGAADVSYLREITWDGWYFDLFRVDLRDGSKQLVARKLRESPNRISPGGRYVVYYRSPHWFLFDGESGISRNLTESLPVPFSDEDHDYPEPAPGYGVADWVAPAAAAGGAALEAEAVVIYDKYDLWQFPVGGGEPLELTAGEGRRRQVVFRLVDLDPEDEPREHVEPGERLLLAAYHDRLKHQGFAEARAGAAGVRFLEEGRGEYYEYVTRAADAPRLLFTRESYTEFPDLWLADLSLGGSRRLSDANPEIARFAWGEAELVEWPGDDGAPLQGVLIKPGNYVAGQRYPVLVYFYRLFSQRLHRFNELAVNHRPSFPYYASHGYAIFLPDIRFEVGRPGLSSTKALVSGVEELVRRGIADPAAIGLHGHSWSGYQTAFVVTQTDVFAAAAAGAPVANMTSAYGGIRYGSGLARMFQYEQSQSRVGATLWNGRDRYIESSPLFYADRVHTPLLIEFGDEDDAVPWTQGIELYLALRRLDKPSWFLEYRGEPHHLRKYPNKLDYTIKMREFFDHYLKGAPAPAWMTEGVPYRGK